MHIVEAWGLGMSPEGGAESPIGKGFAVGSFVGEFDAFAWGGEDHRVIADDIATADGVEADFVGGAFADHAVASVADILLVLEVADIGQDFREFFGGTAGGIFFEAVMHFDDFEVEIGAENFGSFLGEKEEGIDADAVVWGEDDGDLGGGVMDGVDLGIGVTGGTDDESFLGFEAEGEDGFDDGVVREVDDGVGDLEGSGEVIAEIDLGGDLEIGEIFSGGDEGLAHAPAGAIDEEAKRRHWVRGERVGGEWRLVLRREKGPFRRVGGGHRRAFCLGRRGQILRERGWVR